MSGRYFEDRNHAKLYADNRPRYTQAVFDRIFSYCQDGEGKFTRAVDVGCGTGHQSTPPLLSRFQNVIGVDVSEAQLSLAPIDVPNLEFKQSPAENMPFLESGSVDLVLSACSLHWFDIPKFFQEVERVLTPGGCLAAYVYSWVSLPEPEGQKILEKFIASYLSDFITERHIMGANGYSSLELPFSDGKRYHTECCMDWTIDQLCGFMASYSTWQSRLKVDPECHALEHLAKELTEFYLRSNDVETTRIRAIFPVTILLGRKSHT